MGPSMKSEENRSRRLATQVNIADYKTTRNTVTIILNNMSNKYKTKNVITRNIKKATTNGTDIQFFKSSEK